MYQDCEGGLVVRRYLHRTSALAADTQLIHAAEFDVERAVDGLLCGVEGQRMRTDRVCSQHTTQRRPTPRGLQQPSPTHIRRHHFDPHHDLRLAFIIHTAGVGRCSTQRCRGLLQW
jgi:hypothetical protein